MSLQLAYCSLVDYNEAMTSPTTMGSALDRIHAYEAELDAKLAAAEIDEDDYERLACAAWLQFTREAQ